MASLPRSWDPVLPQFRQMSSDLAALASRAPATMLKSLLPHAHATEQYIRRTNARSSYPLAGALLLAITLSVLVFSPRIDEWGAPLQAYGLWSEHGPFSASPITIPKQIYQIFLNNGTEELRPNVESAMLTWHEMNPNYTNTLIDSTSVIPLLEEIAEHHPVPVTMFQNLNSTVLRADHLRYLILAAKGGVYADVDTRALEPVDSWIPEEYRDRARVVLGIEYDEPEHDKETQHFPQTACITQWTFAVVPDHPLMWQLVDDVALRLEKLADSRKQPLWEMTNEDLDGQEVLKTTGPPAWTDSIVKYLRSVAPANATQHDLMYHALHGIKEPKLIGDVLVLSVDAFASGQYHSGSLQDDWSDEVKEAAAKVQRPLVRHLWTSSWTH